MQPLADINKQEDHRNEGCVCGRRMEGREGTGKWGGRIEVARAESLWALPRFSARRRGRRNEEWIAGGPAAGEREAVGGASESQRPE